jgi:hypothetical protein
MPSPLRIWHPFTNAALDPPLRVVRAEGIFRLEGAQHVAPLQKKLIGWRSCSCR